MTAPSIKEALEPCPFCGGDAELKDGYPYNIVKCNSCGARSFTQEDAVTAWNRRTDLATLSPPAGEKREAIRQLVIECAGFVESGEISKIDEAILAFGLVQNEAGILKAMEQECWTLRCVDIPTGGGDADVGWEVIQHHQAKPYERMIAHGRTPQEALNAAIRSAATGVLRHEADRGIVPRDQRA
jgi:Lar family restriction alleviation protein